MPRTPTTVGRSRPAPSAGRQKPVRVTVDLEPDAYDGLRDWAHEARMTHSDVMRHLVHLLTTDAQISAQVRAAAA